MTHLLSHDNLFFVSRLFLCERTGGKFTYNIFLISVRAKLDFLMEKISQNNKSTLIVFSIYASSSFRAPVTKRNNIIHIQLFSLFLQSWANLTDGKQNNTIIAFNLSCPMLLFSYLSVHVLVMKSKELIHNNFREAILITRRETNPISC